MQDAQPIWLRKMYSCAAWVMPEPLGPFDYKDLVGECLESLSKSNTEDEISKRMSSPRYRERALINTRTSIYRWYTAAMRGGREPPIALEKVEGIMGSGSNRATEKSLAEKERKQLGKTLLDELMDSANLSPTERDVIELDRKGHVAEEIARELQTTKNTVYSRRSEARRKLAEAIDESLREKIEDCLSD